MLDPIYPSHARCLASGAVWLVDPCFALQIEGHSYRTPGRRMLVDDARPSLRQTLGSGRDTPASGCLGLSKSHPNSLIDIARSRALERSLHIAPL